MHILHVNNFRHI